MLTPVLVLSLLVAKNAANENCCHCCDTPLLSPALPWHACVRVPTLVPQGGAAHIHHLHKVSQNFKRRRSAAQQPLKCQSSTRFSQQCRLVYCCNCQVMEP